MEYATHTKIRFLYDARYCQDGFKVERALKGEIRELGNNVAADLVRGGKAEVVA